MSLEANQFEGRALIKLCAELVRKVEQNEAAIAERLTQVQKYRDDNARFNEQIEAMHAAIQAGKPYTPAK